MKLFDSFKLRTKLIAGFLTVALIIALVGIVGYNAANKMYENQEEFTDIRLPSVQTLLAISEAQTSINNSVNQILLNAINDRDYNQQLENIDSQLKKIENQWKEYTAMPTTTEAEKMKQDFMMFWNVWKKSIDEFVELANQYNISKSEDIKMMMIVKNIGTNDRYFVSSKSRLEDLVKLNVEYADAAREDMKIMYDNLSKIIILAVLVGFILAILFGFYLSSNISKPIIASAAITSEIAKGNLTVHIKNEKATKEIKQMFMSLSQMTEGLKEMVGRISTASQRLSSSSYQLAANSEEASSVSANIATTINQISEGITELAQEMQSINNNINQTNSEIDNMQANVARAVEGSKKVYEESNNGLIVSEKAVNKIKEIQKTSMETFEVISLLGDESKKINEIVDVIKEISEQTNLLALNAAIEAARAGEYGKGFAVVADEVRKLAEQSGDSAQQIVELITKIYQEMEKAICNVENSTKEVDEGVEIVSEAGRAFRTIVGEIEKIVSQFEYINESIQLIANSSKEIANSISSVSAITEEAAASTEEVSASTEEQSAVIQEVSISAQELAKMAEELNSVISRFKL